MELSGAPITTLAKRVPLVKRNEVRPKPQFSPKFEACKQREGLVVGKSILLSFDL